MGVLDMFRKKPTEPGGGFQTLLDQKLQWPTEEMLRSRGMNDKQIAAYQSLTKAMDYACDRLDDIRLKDGLQPIYRRPGRIEMDDEYFSAVSNYYAESLFKHEVLKPTEERLQLIPENDAERAALVALIKAKNNEYLKSVAAIAKYHPEILP